MNKQLETLIKRYPALSVCEEEIEKAYEILEECFAAGHKLLIAGNGGSCADGEHIAGELMKGFKLQRKCTEEFAKKLKSIDAERGAELAEKLQGGLPTIAQQVYGYGKAGDVLLGISTSGNSKNVAYAAVVARAKGMKVIGLTGAKGGNLASVADVTIKVSETETYMIQELHLPVYHCLCLMLEERFFGGN